MKHNKLVILFVGLAMLACEPAPEPAPRPVEEAPPAVVQPAPPVFNDPAAKGREIDRASNEDPLPKPLGFCSPGEACDTSGSAVLAAGIDVTESSIRVVPDNKLFATGDPLSFEVCARKFDRSPVVGVPAIVILRQEARTLAGDGTTLTKANGCVLLAYVMQDKDQIGDPNTPEPDSGSYFVDGYVGGRRVQKVAILHDTF